MAPAATLLGVLRLLFADADRAVWARLAAALLVVGTGGLLTALAPLALKSLVDVLAASPDAASAISRAVPQFAFIYVATLCAGRFVADLRPLLLGAVEQRLRTQLSRRFVAHVLDLPPAFHADQKSGAISHKLAQASSASQLVLTHLVQALPLAVELLTVIVVLTHLGQPALAAVFVASAAAYVAVFRDGTARVRGRSKQVAARSADAQAAIADALQNIEPIKCFNAHDAVNRRFGTLTDTLECSWLDLHRQKMKLGMAAAGVFTLSVGASFTVALHAVGQGSLTVGGFVLCTVYILQMIRPVEALGAAARDIGQAIEFIEPVLGVLRLPVERTAPTSPRERPHLPTPEPMDIRLLNVHLSYGKGPAVLRGLDLHIRAGEMLAIVGPSGSGKSSLARILLGLATPQSGQVIFGQTCSEQLAPAEVRAMIGYVPQDVVLFDDTIAANVALARPGATRPEIEEACRGASAHDFIQSLPAGYGTLVGGRGLKLSGGERQRIAIARAILKRPQAYLFDEATSALDSQTESDIVAGLREACSGRTTVFITHRLAAAQHADRVALLQDGRILELGTHTELLGRQGAYAGMHRLQASIRRDDMQHHQRALQA